MSSPSPRVSNEVTSSASSPSSSSSSSQSYFGWLDYINPFTSRGSAVDLNDENTTAASGQVPNTATRERFVLESGERVVITNDETAVAASSGPGGDANVHIKGSMTGSREKLPVVSVTKVKGSELSTPTPTYTYADFARRMKMSSPRLTQALKRFVADMDAKSKLDLESCSMIHTFTTQMYGQLVQLPEWAEADPGELDNAFESIERFCVSKLYHRIFPSNDNEMSELDARVSKAMYTLSWIRPEHLDIPPAYWDHVLLDHAASELRKMDDYRSPRDKIVCLLNACKVICSLLKSAYNKYQRRKLREQRAREREEQRLEEIAKSHVLEESSAQSSLIKSNMQKAEISNGQNQSNSFAIDDLFAPVDDSPLPEKTTKDKPVQGKVVTPKVEDGKTEDMEEDGEDANEDGEETFKALAAAAAEEAAKEREAAMQSSTSQSNPEFTSEEGTPSSLSSENSKLNSNMDGNEESDSSATSKKGMSSAQATAANMVGRYRPESTKPKYDDVPLSMGADTFVPLFLYVILRAVPNRIYLNIEFMRMARHPTKLRGEADYYVTQLQSAAAFFLRCDPTCFSVPKDVFEANVKKLGEEYEQIKMWEAQLQQKLANNSDDVTSIESPRDVIKDKE